MVDVNEKPINTAFGGVQPFDSLGNRKKKSIAKAARPPDQEIQTIND
jgi:hypothetical protein